MCIILINSILHLQNYLVISKPHDTHPMSLSLAKSSMRGNRPHNRTIKSRTMVGFAEWRWGTDSIIELIEWSRTLTRPFVAIRHTSALDRVYQPMPIKLPPFLFFFTQLNPKVLYVKPHALITSNAFSNCGNVTHRNKKESLSVMSLTNLPFTRKFFNSSMLITGYLHSAPLAPASALSL